LQERVGVKGFSNVEAVERPLPHCANLTGEAL